MATVILGKQSDWEGTIDDQGYREYSITWKVMSDFTDGPANVMQTPGLYLPGSIWEIDNDIDIYVWCKPGMDVKPLGRKDGEKGQLWLVKQKFTNKPSSNQRCQDIRIEDPLLEPQKLSGGFLRKTREQTHDRFGNPLVNSAWEQLRGQQVEFDDDLDQVKIEQNVLFLDYSSVASIKNCVNKYSIWGVPPRCVKLSEFTWDQKQYGQCFFYYVRKFTFDVDMKTFDRTIPDEGTKVLNGQWNPTTKLWIDININNEPPNPKNPGHFIRYQDLNGNTTRAILDGNGRPWNPLLPPIVTTCPQCPSAAPRYWEVNLADSFFDGSFQKQTLLYSSGCIWGNVSTTLQYVAEENPGEGNYWILSDLDTGVQWFREASLWSCTGTNLMSQLGDANEDLPETLEVKASTKGSLPGYRYIQFYKEADFLSVLGIPAIL